MIAVANISQRRGGVGSVNVALTPDISIGTVAYQYRTLPSITRADNLVFTYLMRSEALIGVLSGMGFREVLFGRQIPLTCDYFWTKYTPHCQLDTHIQVP